MKAKIVPDILAIAAIVAITQWTKACTAESQIAIHQISSPFSNWGKTIPFCHFYHSYLREAIQLQFF